MKEYSPPDCEALSSSLGRRIDETCDHFEASWRGGVAPKIEDSLHGWEEPERATLVRELIQLDLHYRRIAGTNCLAEDYLDRFASLDGDWLTALLTDADSPSSTDALTLTHLPESSDVSEGVEESYDFLAPPRNAGDLGCLGPYDVLKVLGVGGMGVVFQAYDPQLERLVAIKAMAPALAASASARQRFMREAKATAAIKHDHIVTIYQVGEDRGVPFLAMEFLEGEPLDVRLAPERRGESAAPLSLREALRISREIAEGLDAAHQRGLIHRDVKPANVWLEGGRRRVKLLDFGLARAVADNANLTQQGAVVGTPAYMAPEQIAGNPVDARTDLFSLGCVIYRMTTGEPAFQGTNAISLFIAITTQAPAPPRERNPALPTAVSDLVMQLLAKNADDRPPSARAVIETIEAIEKNGAALPEDLNDPTAIGMDADEGRRILRYSEGRGNLTTTHVLRSTSERAASPARPATFRRFWPWAAAALLGLTVYWCGAVVVRFATNKRELVIKSDNRRDEAPPVSLSINAAETALTALLGRDTDAKANLDELRLAVAEFRQQHAGSPQALKAAKFLEGLPSPLDALNHEQISPYELSVAGGGDPQAAPKELTAVLGDSRLRHTAWAGPVVFSRDGRKIISGSFDGTVRVWDTTSGELLQTIGWGATARPSLSPDGRTVAVWGDRPEVVLWDLETGKSGRMLNEHTGGILDATFSGDGKMLATAGADGSIKLWDVATGIVRRTLLGRKEGFFTLAFSPDDQTLTGAVYDSRLVLEWDVNGERGPRETTRGKVGAISPDGKRLATVYEADNSVKVLDAASGMENRVLVGSKYLTRAVAFSPDGRLLASGGYGGELTVWNLDTGTVYQDLSYSDRCSILCIAFSHDGRLLASAGDDRRVRLWDVNTGKEHISLRPGSGHFAAVGPDGRTLTTSDGIYKIKILDMATGQESQKLPNTDFTGRQALAPDGRSLLSMNWHGLLYLWNLTTAEPQTVGAHPNGFPTALVISPDGALAASAVGTLEVKLWDLAAKREIRSFTHIGPVYGVAFSPDGRMLAAATKDKVVKVWSTADGRELKTLLGSCVAFSPEGLLAVAASDAITLYDAASWKELRTLHRTGSASSEPFSLAFNPSGRLVVTSNDDGKIVVWDLNDDKAAPRSFWVCRPRQTDGEIAFTPEGRYLVSANANGTTYILRLTPPSGK